MEPKLRFKADGGSQFPDWEEKELGQILTEDLYPVENPDDSYTKLAIRSHGKGTFDRHVEAGESLDVDKMFEVKANRLILNITFAWELAIAITTKEDEGKLVSHRFPQYKIAGNVDFYKYRLINERMRYDLGVASPGGAGRNRVLNKSAFLKIRKYIPSFSEQQKIAEFLSTIDTVIEKQKETVSAWEERKKGVMQKVFSQEVRFKADGESDFPDWEEKKIDDVATCFAGATPSTRVSEYWEEGMIRWMSSGEVNNGQIYDTEKRISQLGFDKCSTKMVKPNTVVMALAGQGKTRGMVAITRVPLCTNQSLCSIETNDDICDDYLYQYLQTQYNNLRLISSGDGTRGGLNLKLAGGYTILVPCIAEQQKIADCLSSLDEVIEKQKAILAAWEELKKGLLQQMFV